ncbi:MAG: MBL fold metallo-hydrolase [Ruminococcaceae bacterium]|nr:MBL fold metallo-hydrolase [Oscillospiraceae bacterium]
MAEKKSWHKTEQLNEDTWRIIEGDIISCYLLLGEERAMLIDTGNGMGNIGAQVTAITDLPVTVALTHRHCDHAGGRRWFPFPAHVHEADMTIIGALASCGLSSRVLAAKWTTSKDFLKKPYNAGYTAITDGAEFDLGGRVVRVISLPGHTPGSVAYLDEKHKMLFGGDNIMGSEIWLFVPGALSVEEWVHAVERVRELCDEYTPYSGHGAGLLTVEQIDLLIRKGKALMETKRNRLFRGKKTYEGEGGGAVIIYNPARIHAKKKNRR